VTINIYLMVLLNSDYKFNIHFLKAAYVQKGY